MQTTTFDHCHQSVSSEGRVAYSLSEAAKLFGKDRSWIYRMVNDDKIHVIRGFGAMMIPASEIKRICEGGAVVAR